MCVCVWGTEGTFGGCRFVTGRAEKQRRGGVGGWGGATAEWKESKQEKAKFAAFKRETQNATERSRIDSGYKVMNAQDKGDVQKGNRGC